MADKLTQVFESYVGYLEKASNKNLEDKTANAGYNNYTIFAKKYYEYTGNNYQGQAWCAMFVSDCFVEAFGLAKAKSLLCGSLYSYCPSGMQAFKAKGRLYTKPKERDIVFFIRGGIPKHTGYVYKVSGNSIYTIEGNTSASAGVIPNGGGVFKKSYTVNSNMLFGRPNYDGTTSATNTTPAVNTSNGYSNKEWMKALQTEIGTAPDGIPGPKTLAACPLLKRGAKGTVVKLMQQRLQSYYNIPLQYGADGEFGYQTEVSVKKFQRMKGISADGIVGRNTWTKLLGL